MTDPETYLAELRRRMRTSKNFVEAYNLLWIELERLARK